MAVGLELLLAELSVWKVSLGNLEVYEEKIESFFVYGGFLAKCYFKLKLSRKIYLPCRAQRSQG